MQKNQIIPGLLFCGIAALILPAFQQAQDPNILLCANSMRSNITALNSYVLDWDETYPTWSSNWELDIKLKPYQAVTTDTFSCPATHHQYLFNDAMQGITQASINDPSVFEVLRDSSPHPDGLISIGYSDSRVTHGGVFVGDNTQLCIDSIKQVALGLEMYAQDYDEMLPPMDSASQVKSLIFPYIRVNNVYTCPVTGQPYQYNASLSNTSLGAYPDPSVIWTLQDSIPHPDDGISTVGFLDGHVYRPGWPHYPMPGDTTMQCIQNQQKISRGISMYAQDYDETLPKLTNSTSTLTLLIPYVRSSEPFICPQTGLHYLFDSALSGRTIASFANPANYWVLTDNSPHPDGQKTTSYLNGLVFHPGYSGPPGTVQNCIKSVRQDLLATMMYAQDYDEVLPAMHSAAEYDRLLIPYTQSNRAFTCPLTKFLYLPTYNLSSVSISSIEQPYSTIVLQDSRRHSEGSITLGYLDGHAHLQSLPRIPPTGPKRKVPGN